MMRAKLHGPFRDYREALRDVERRSCALPESRREHVCELVGRSEKPGVVSYCWEPMPLALSELSGAFVIRNATELGDIR